MFSISLLYILMRHPLKFPLHFNQQLYCLKKVSLLSSLSSVLEWRLEMPLTPIRVFSDTLALCEIELTTRPLEEPESFDCTLPFAHVSILFINLKQLECSGLLQLMRMISVSATLCLSSSLLKLYGIASLSNPRGYKICLKMSGT
jgi:hypothetical protein